MAKRISEPDLVLPTLYFINEHGSLPTKAISKFLRDLLQPKGEDAEINKSRPDDKFSQIVRNLKSHDKLQKLGLATYTEGYWSLTEKGIIYLQSHEALLKYLFEQRYSEETALEALSKITKSDGMESWDFNLFDETLSFEEAAPVIEGKERIVKQKVYERSLKLRQSAIKYFSKNNRILCEVCGFDFQAVYGEHGKGFIEVHHMKPIFTYGVEDIEKTLQDAISNLVPLCSNCHRMIHRRRDKMLSIDELKSLIKR